MDSENEMNNFFQVRLMVGLAPITAPALHQNSILHPLATNSQWVNHRKYGLKVKFSLQLCRLLSLTGNYEFLAKGSVIQDLKQGIFGKVGKRRGSAGKPHSGE